MELLNNREISALIWLSLLSLVLLIKYADLRKSSLVLLKDFFHPKICLILLATFTPLVLVLLLLARYEFLESYMLKDVVLWFLTAGVVMFFKTTTIKSEKDFFRKTALSLMKATLILEFIVNLYVFPLIIEIILLPLITVPAIMLTYIESIQNENYKQIQAPLRILLGLMGIFIVSFTMMQIVSSPKEFFTLANMKLIILPVALTALYTPFVYLLAVFSAYEAMFISLGSLYPAFQSSNQVKLACIRKCHISVQAIVRMKSFLVREIMDSLKEKDILQLIHDYPRSQK